MSNKIKRATRSPRVSYRHPITGAHVVVDESVDVELECLFWSGRYDQTIARMAEVASQSVQNRARIARRTTGGGWE